MVVRVENDKLILQLYVPFGLYYWAIVELIVPSDQVGLDLKSRILKILTYLGGT